MIRERETFYLTAKSSEDTRGILATCQGVSPDVSTSNSMKQWNIILDAYQLLQSYWDSDTELFDCRIRILSRNSKLMEHERICWLDTCHNKQQEQLQSLEENNNINTDLAEFQSKLVRLLSSDSLIESGLCLAQLPKEYEKSYQEKVPNSKDYGYNFFKEN